MALDLCFSFTPCSDKVESQHDRPGQVHGISPKISSSGATATFFPVFGDCFKHFVFGLAAASLSGWTSCEKLAHVFISSRRRLPSLRLWRRVTRSLGIWHCLLRAVGFTGSRTFLFIVVISLPFGPESSEFPWVGAMFQEEI